MFINCPEKQFVIIMILDNDVTWQPLPWPRVSPDTGDTPGPPLTTDQPLPLLRPGTGLFSHFQCNAAPNSRHFFVSFISVFLRLRLGTESDVWWEAEGGWRRGQRLTSPGPVSSLSQARRCPVSPPLDWPLQSPQEQHSCTLERVSCDWTGPVRELHTSELV